MQIIKSLSIFKNKKVESDKAPSHKLSGRIGESFVDLGSAWTKETKTGDKFLSVQLSKAWVDHTDQSKSRKSVVLCFEEDLKALFKECGREWVEDKINEKVEPIKEQTTSSVPF